MSTARDQILEAFRAERAVLRYLVRRSVHEFLSRFPRRASRVMPVLHYTGKPTAIEPEPVQLGIAGHEDMLGMVLRWRLSAVARNPQTGRPGQYWAADFPDGWRPARAFLGLGQIVGTDEQDAYLAMSDDLKRQMQTYRTLGEEIQRALRALEQAGRARTETFSRAGLIQARRDPDTGTMRIDLPHYLSGRALLTPIDASALGLPT